jgi:HTH-type transcriptional regulator/antitoxin HigA
MGNWNLRALGRRFEHVSPALRRQLRPEPSLPGAPASGASRWYRAHGLITLTLRYLSDDQFWHSVYHEAGHLVSGRRGRMVLEELEYEHDGDDERAANEFARDLLIPRWPV